jgi:hypothetical protein
MTLAMVPACEIEPGDVIYNYEFQQVRSRAWVPVRHVRYSENAIRIETDAFVRIEHPTKPLVVRRSK